MTTKNSFGSRATLAVDGEAYVVYRLDALDAVRRPRQSPAVQSQDPARESPAKRGRRLREADDILALATWDVRERVEKEIAFRTARVLLQDFTGVPCVVDLAAMRDAIATLGGDAEADQPAPAGRSGHRPLGAGRRVRHAGGVSHQHRARVRAQQRALRRFCAGGRRRSRTSASCRRAPASATR